VTAPAYDPRAGVYAAGRHFGLAEPEHLPRPDPQELELLVRFEHPAKLLAVAELPGAAGLSDGCLSEAYATTAATLEQVRARLARRVRDAAAELVADGTVQQAVRALPVPTGGCLVALGDSITDDLLSWAEVLRECVGLVRPGEISVVNAGVSGDTTADVLSRLYGVLALRPDLVIAMLGTNDCQRHGPGEERLVADGESDRNVAAISDWVRRSGARLVWLTPPPVLAPALAAAMGDRPLRVRDGDVSALAQRLAGSEEEVIDVAAYLRAGSLPELLLADGVHLDLAGHLVVVAALLRHRLRP